MRSRSLAAAAVATALALLLAGGSGAVTPRLEQPAGTTARQPGPGEGTASRRQARVVTPTLTSRATLAADFLSPGPPSGALATPANGRTGPFAGQVVPGFSGMVDNGDGTFWGLPDNGFGSKANSADFLLRLYLIRPSWETADGGAGTIETEKFLSLRDPDHKIGFPLVNEGTRQRLLTGADFDPEAVVRAEDGSFWIGEGLGCFLLHVSADGTVLSAPAPLAAGRSCDSASPRPSEVAGNDGSRGLGALAVSPDGQHLYAVVSGAATGDADQRRRLIYEFDTRKNRYTGQTWEYQTDRAANVVGDAQLTKENQLLLIERDDFEGPAAATKRVYRVDLTTTDADGYVEKSLLVDLLKIANPDRIGTRSAAGAYGVSLEFSFPFSVETLVWLGADRLLLANDNNYPGSAARKPGTPDDTELVVVELRRGPVPDPSPTLIAHRGASGYRPEHTLAAYELAIRMCADYIEPDVVSTKDGVLIARHENEIGGTTNVADVTQFAERRTTKSIDGKLLTGWFTEDFTLAELRTLRARERLPEARPANTAFDGIYEIPTLDEVADLARHSRTCSGQQVGVYPETKHPTYFSAIGLPLESRLLSVLGAAGFSSRSDPVVIQSYEPSNLTALARRTDIPLVQLVDCIGAPYDLVARGDDRTYADLVTPGGLQEISEYADGVGLCKDVMIPRDPAGNLLEPTAVIPDAHRLGLTVTGFAFRRENQFLPTRLRSSADPAAPGDLAGEVRIFLAAGMDGLFADDPDIGYQVLTE